MPSKIIFKMFTSFVRKLRLPVYDVIWYAESMYKTCMDIGKSVRNKKNVKLPLYMNIKTYGGVVV